MQQNGLIEYCVFLLGNHSEVPALSSIPNKCSLAGRPGQPSSSSYSR